MAEALSIFDDPDADAEARAITQAEADIAAGRMIPLDEVVAWIRSWGTATELPRPQCK